MKSYFRYLGGALVLALFAALALPVFAQTESDAPVPDPGTGPGIFTADTSGDIVGLQPTEQR